MSGIATRPPLSEVFVSVVLPAYNEHAALPRLRELIVNALAPTGCRLEILFINDGSTDGSDRLLDRMAREDARVRVLHLSRNFGHQAAVQAGLAHARGDAVIVMDSDLQDDPNSLPRMLEQWRAGYDVVYAVRFARKENVVKRAMFYAFYRVLNAVSNTPLPADAGNFGLMDRSVVKAIVDLPEADRYFSGLRGWVGFRQTGIAVERLERHDDQPRVSLFGLFRLAKTAIFSFSSAPLAMFYAIAGLSLCVSIAFMGHSLYHKLFTGEAIPGWTSHVIIGALFGSLNALGIGVLGEYVVRIYDQVRGRPKFIVAREVSRDRESPEITDAGANDLTDATEAIETAESLASPVSVESHR